ncbi:MAG: hypothetical protein V3V08_26000 [Nannocystaceae bacterium]
MCETTRREGYRRAVQIVINSRCGRGGGSIAGRLDRLVIMVEQREAYGTG